MGLLDNILDRVEKKVASAAKTVKKAAKTVYNSVVTQDTTVVVKPQQTTTPEQPKKMNKPAQPNSIMEKKESTPVQSKDKTTTIQQKTQTFKAAKKTNSTTITKEQIHAKNRAILTKANSLGITKQELDDMLIERGLTEEKVINMSIEEQYSTLCDIEQVLDIQKELKNKGVMAADVNIAKMVDENSKVTTEARKAGVLDNSKEAKKYQYAERMRKLLGEDFNELSLEEKRERIDFVSNTIRQEYNADYEKKI